MENQDNLSHEPIYNIRSVSTRTGITPETIRAWERRYGFPAPFRNPKGYRLYTEDEIAALSWLKQQTQQGMTIRQAIRLLTQLKSSGQDPIQGLKIYSGQFSGKVIPPPELADELLRCLVSLDEAQAHQILNTAFAQHPLAVFLLDIVSPTLVEIGEMWHDGTIPVAIEHFSSQICLSHLVWTLDRLPAMDEKGRIITACAPGEWHELGLLILTLLLKEKGWAVTYLGPNLSLERFSEVLVRLNPELVLFSATSPSTAERLLDLLDVLEGLPDPKPVIGLGGLAFLEDPTLANRIPGTFFGPRADEAVRQIEQMILPLRTPKADREELPDRN